MSIQDRVVLVIAVAVCTALLVSSTRTLASQFDSLESISYADWSNLSPDARREVFNKVTPAKRASLVRAHIENWRERQRRELDANQLEFIDVLLASVTSANYGKSTRMSLDKRTMERAQLLFYPEQLVELLGMRLPSDARFDSKP
jgi:hypothetical protein